MSPTHSTHSELLPSTSTTFPTINTHTIYHTNPSISSVWTIFALTFIVIVITGVVCYSLYSCYHSAIYQQELEITDSLCQYPQESKSARKNPSKSRVRWEKWAKERGSSEEKTGSKCSILNSDFNHSLASFDSSSTMPDLSCPPLAVTYSTNSPRMHHASPIVPLPKEHDHVKLCPTPVFFDSNSIPFYVPDTPLHSVLNPKLAPVGGCFDSRLTESNTPSEASIAVSDSSLLPHSLPGPETTGYPQFKSQTSARTRSLSPVNQTCDPFSRSIQATAVIKPAEKSNLLPDNAATRKKGHCDSKADRTPCNSPRISKGSGRKTDSSTKRLQTHQHKIRSPKLGFSVIGISPMFKGKSRQCVKKHCPFQDVQNWDREGETKEERVRELDIFA
ncbi:hypothetical protein GYMLUDRAFT_244777 [Collybiopsis luxurians FD-317 M1]|uniref:Unplaced genomic scaffold GYMLUscaffold_29, whole genome shotgun sequence n=1 Tax=Collybiopsis luxurians FD-317 M1 TaxID=944289 RepID=A0A0D0B8Y6_9AGAR|nr:hypothetical protein GYMLUDRAFT_244777 [Collybiopsis luxurians FD-317 M1]